MGAALKKWFRGAFIGGASGLISNAVSGSIGNYLAKSDIGGAIGGAIQGTATAVSAGLTSGTLIGMANGEGIGKAIESGLSSAYSGIPQGAFMGAAVGAINSQIQGNNPLNGRIHKNNVVVAPTKTISIGNNIVDNDPNLWKGSVSGSIKNNEGNATLYSIDVNFGGDENQVYHTFRYIDGYGLNRVEVSTTILQDLGNHASSFSPGMGQLLKVNISGVPIKYSAYMLPSGVIKVGSIRPPR